MTVFCDDILSSFFQYESRMYIIIRNYMPFEMVNYLENEIRLNSKRLEQTLLGKLISPHLTRKPILLNQYAI